MNKTTNPETNSPTVGEILEVANGVKQPPHNFDLEFQLLGVILMDNKFLSHIHFLTPDDFYSAPHTDIFQAMLKAYDAGEAISPFTLLRHLKNPSVFEDTTKGAQKYLAGAISASSAVLNAIDHAKYILELSQRRRLIEKYIAMMEDAHAETCRPDQHIAKITVELSEIASSSPAKIFFDNYEVGEKILKDLKSNVLPYQTGFKKLDEAMEGGLYSGKCYGFVARKKVGKTAFAATLSSNLNDAKVKHLFICCEMSKEEVHQRVLARKTESYLSAFRSDYGKSLNFEKKLAEVLVGSSRNTLYYNAPGITFDDLKHIAQLAMRHKIRGFILDYWQLIGGKQKGQSTAEHLDEVAQWLANFARQNDIFTIVMGQLNQDDNTRGSEGIRLACDQLYQIHRPDVTEPDMWLEMLETRYTKWVNIGTKTEPGFLMNDKGVYFEEV